MSGLPLQYRYFPQSYIDNLNTLDKTKAESFRQWARLRSQLSRLKMLILGDGEG